MSHHLAGTLREALEALEARLHQSQHTAVHLPDPDDELLALIAGQPDSDRPPVLW